MNTMALTGLIPFPYFNIPFHIHFTPFPHFNIPFHSPLQWYSQPLPLGFIVRKHSRQKVVCSCVHCKRSHNKQVHEWVHEFLISQRSTYCQLGWSGMNLACSTPELETSHRAATCTCMPCGEQGTSHISQLTIKSFPVVQTCSKTCDGRDKWVTSTSMLYSTGFLAFTAWRRTLQEARPREGHATFLSSASTLHMPYWKWEGGGD